MNDFHDMDAVILANGDYPSASLPLRILKEAPYVVCCDGGANEYIAKGYLPDVIIGDGDSLSQENRIKYASLICYNPDQETNDQTKAIQYLLAQGKRRIAIVGATGKREDHTIGNISLLMEYMQMTLAFGSTKCSQCLCSTGLRRFKIFLLKKRKKLPISDFGE